MIDKIVFYQYIYFITDKFFGHPYMWGGLVIVSIFNAMQLAKYIFIRDKKDISIFFAGLIVFVVVLISIAIIDNLGDVNMVHGLLGK